MRATQIKTLDTGRRVQAFFDAQAAALHTVIPASLRSKLDAAIAQLAAYQLEQGTALVLKHIETALLAAHRRDCYEQLIRPIGIIAKYALSDDRSFRLLVLSAASASKRDFTVKASTLAYTAELHEAVFVSNGMPADFVQKLDAALAQIAESADAWERHRFRHVEATAGAKAAAQSVGALVRVVDSVLRPVVKGDASLLSDWTAAKSLAQSVKIAGTTG